MKWYAASIIMYIEFKDGNQNKYPIWENVILIRAISEEEAFQKAEQIGKDSEGDAKNSTYWEDRPATWKYGGVRKLLECIDQDNVIKDGAEITYSQFEIKDESSLRKLINGDEVSITYEV